jgi:hypothetical protein
MIKFVKISELSSEDRTKLKGYWSELWGKEFANALVTDFETDGDKIKVKASNKKMKKKATFDDTLGDEGLPSPPAQNPQYNLEMDFSKTLLPALNAALTEIMTIGKTEPEAKALLKGYVDAAYPQINLMTKTDTSIAI